MKSTNREVNRVEQVNVARRGTNRVALDEPNPALDMSRLISGLTSVGTSPLAVRPEQRLIPANDRKPAGTASIRISLFEGKVLVNGRPRRIPTGLSGPMSGKQFKEFAGIYAGNALFIRRNGGLQRVRDSQSIEVADDTEFTSRREQPEVTSIPRYRRD